MRSRLSYPIVADPHQLQRSYDWCAQEARRAASNFYYAFYLLPRAKRRSMYALYTFLRHADDLSENSEPVGQRQQSLAELRSSLNRSLSGQFDGPMFAALADTVSRHAIPAEYLFAAIDGVEMDLSHQGFETFNDLETYCYRVASVVGLSCIHVWGFDSARALEPAKQCGLAFQLTNILRDLREDAEHGRVYLPREDLRRFDYTEQDLKSRVCDQRFEALMQFQIARAERLYDSASSLAAHLYWDGRRILHCMLATYRALLEQIKQCRVDVFRRRVRVNGWQKSCIAVRSLLVRRPYIAGLK
jgi:15-cis-phytoene synthase